MKISLQDESQSFRGMPDKSILMPGQDLTISLTKGYGTQGILVVYPQNANIFSNIVKDGQAQVLTPHYLN
jgi:archaellum component FlaF (FlaF/FlaG flagellin family)